MSERDAASGIFLGTGLGDLGFLESLTGMPILRAEEREKSRYSERMPSESELRQAIATYVKLIANYSIVRDRLLAQIATLTDGDSAELTHRLDANARTISFLERAVEVARDQLKLSENSAVHQPT